MVAAETEIKTKKGREGEMERERWTERGRESGREREVAREKEREMERGRMERERRWEYVWWGG